MGNLLNTPVTEKETHTGITKGEGLKYGLSSMQGWRVHMEDAHIAEVDLYALKTVAQDIGGGGGIDGGPNNGDRTMTTTTTTTTKIPLPGHSLFAVFDGHGGTFAAMYSGRNFLRILSHQKKFVEYAELVAKDGDSPGNRIDRLHCLEEAFKQAFVETDYEIALAVRGNPHPHANQEYHTKVLDGGGSGGEGGGDDNADTAMKDSVITEPSSSSSTLNMSAEAVASRAAADHVMALDDDDSGTTACMVMITPHALICANAGDSRAVYCLKSNSNYTTDDVVAADDEGNDDDDDSIIYRAVPLSYDHKPDDEAEERRIRTAGGYVAGGRVEGDLAVSRGLGDFRFKHMPTVLSNTQLDENGTRASSSAPVTTMPPGEQKVSPVPDIIVRQRNNEQDAFVIVACDGIWDVRSNQDCVNDVENLFQEGEHDLGLLSEEILDECLRLGSKDNMTVIVIQLPGQVIPNSDVAWNGGKGVMGRRQRRNEVQQRQQQFQSFQDDD